MAKKTIYVTGHKNPDSDEIISSMAYAYLKQQLGYDAIAVRAGAINPETEYILSLFNEFAPPLATDIKTCVRDVDFDDVVTCGPKDDLRTVINLMNDNNVKAVAITDEKRHLLGLITMSDITKIMVVSIRKKNRLLSQTPVDYLAKVLNARVQVDCGNNSNGKVYVASYTYLDVQDKIVLVSDNTERQREVLEAGGKIMVISGKKAAPEIVELAREKKCTVLYTKMSLYDCAKEVDFAIAVEKIMTTDLTTFYYNDYIENVKVKINKSRFRTYPVIDRFEHVIGLIARYHVFQHANRNLILVDHNEPSQSLEGAENANIMEIIDHHRIGGLKTAQPVFFRNEQVGSCATIISEMFEEKGVPIPEDLAGLLCCAIISDTVNFHSVTCTETDIAQAGKMAQIAGLDMEKLGPKILRAGASLAHKSMDDILHHDLKRFEIGKMKVAVGQSNVVNFEAIIGLKNKMNEHLEHFARSNNLDICMMVFSLIDGTGSYCLYQGDGVKAVEYAFEDIAVNVDGFMFLPKVMSRKLQIIPKITAAAEGS